MDMARPNPAIKIKNGHIAVVRSCYFVSEVYSDTDRSQHTTPVVGSCCTAKNFLSEPHTSLGCELNPTAVHWPSRESRQGAGPPPKKKHTQENKRMSNSYSDQTQRHRS